ncbi:MAG: ribonuclease D [Gammaproteobacteria bacterium]|nr:ribonuclease D [Gammaproteobacteria bacterium]
MNKKYLTIENEEDLVKFCEQLKGSPWLAVDTEFERTQTYFPELCLLQVANADIAAIIDPIAIADLDPFFEVLYDKSITKVFHSGHQDLEIFFNLKGSVPTPIFDTQIAAPLLGYAEQIGYAKLVHKLSGVELGKAFTRSDWKQRPLKQGQLEYAINDVTYLGIAYVQFVEKLEKLNRLAWLEKDFSEMTNPDRYQPDPEHIWKKIREAKKLKGKKLAVLQKLAAWREITAREKNRPRNWLIRDDAIVDMAQLLPEDLNALTKIKGLQGKFVKNHGVELLKIIHSAMELSPEPLANIRQSEKLTGQQEAMVDALSVIVRLQAQIHEMNPTALASKKELQAFVQNQDESILQSGWRKPLIGDALAEFMSGNQSISLINNKLSIVTN